VSHISDMPASPDRSMSSLEAFWDRAAISKLEAKFAVAREIEAIPRLSIQQLRAIVFQYRYFTQAFATDLAALILSPSQTWSATSSTTRIRPSWCVNSNTQWIATRSPSMTT